MLDSWITFGQSCINYNGVLKTEKKDPLGITLTEMNHLDKIMNEKFALTYNQHKEVRKELATIKHK